MSEFAPVWSNARMTKAQVKKYVADMKKAQKIAQEKLKKAQESWELDKENKDLEKLEDIIDDL